MAHTYDTKGETPSGTGLSTANPVTMSFTCGSGATVLVLCIVYAGSTARGGGSPTYNSVSMTQADQRRYGSASPECTVEIWYLLNPPTGSSYTLNVPNSGALSTHIWVSSYKAQSGYKSVLDVSNGAGAVGTNPTCSVTTNRDGDVIVAAVANGAQTWSPSGRSGTKLYDADLGSWGGGAQYFLQSTAGSKAMSWTFGTSEDYGECVVAFKEKLEATQSASGGITPSGDFSWTLWEIWRKDGAGGSYNKIRQAAYGINTYDDGASLVNGTTYYHKIRKNILGTLGEWSNETATTFVGTIDKVISGALSISGTLTKTPAKAFTGGLTLAGGLIRRAGKMISGAITTAGALIKQARPDEKEGYITPAGALIKQSRKAFVGSLGTVGGLIRFPLKTLSGGLTAGGSLIKRINKAFTGSITPTGVVAAVRTFIKALTGALSISGNLIKLTYKTFTGGISPAGALIKQARKAFTGGITPAGVLAAMRAYTIVLAGALSMSGAWAGKALKSLTGAVTPAGGLIKRISKGFTGSISPSGILASSKAFLKIIAGSITPSGSVVRQVGKSLAGAISPEGALIRLIKKAFSGILNIDGALIAVIKIAEVAIRRLTLPFRSSRLHISERSDDLTLPERSDDIELPDRSNDLTLPKRPRRLN